MYSFTHSAMYIFMYSSIYISGKVALPSRTPLTSAPAAMVSSRHPSFLSLSLSVVRSPQLWFSLCLCLSFISSRLLLEWCRGLIRLTCTCVIESPDVQRCARPAGCAALRPPRSPVFAPPLYDMSLTCLFCLVAVLAPLALLALLALLGVPALLVLL